MTERTAQRFIGVADKLGAKYDTVWDFTPSVLYELAAPSQRRPWIGIYRIPATPPQPMVGMCERRLPFRRFQTGTDGRQGIPAFRHQGNWRYRRTIWGPASSWGVSSASPCRSRHWRLCRYPNTASDTVRGWRYAELMTQRTTAAISRKE